MQIVYCFGIPKRFHVCHKYTARTRGNGLLCMSIFVTAIYIAIYIFHSKVHITAQPKYMQMSRRFAAGQIRAGQKSTFSRIPSYLRTAEQV